MDLQKLYQLPTECAIPNEFFDFLKILSLGAKKYAPNNWLERDGKKSSEREMHDSMFHHLAESFAGQSTDIESGLDPLLHLACRALMLYTRRQRGIVHEADILLAANRLDGLKQLLGLLSSEKDQKERHEIIKDIKELLDDHDEPVKKLGELNDKNCIEMTDHLERMLIEHSPYFRKAE